MIECVYVSKCRFYNDMLNNVPAAMDVMKKMYCRHNYKDCARYKIAIELEK